MFGKKAKKALKLLLSLSEEERAAIAGELGDADDLQEDDEEETSNETTELENTDGEAQVETSETVENETETEPESESETEDVEEVQETTENEAPEGEVVEETTETVTEEENSVEPDARLGALESAVKEIKETLKALAARFGDGEEPEAEESFGLGAASGDEGMPTEKKLDAVRKKYFGF